MYLIRCALYICYLLSMITLHTVASVSDIRFTNTANVTEFTPGQPIVFTVRLENTSKTPLDNIKVKDLFSQVKATDVAGSEISAFQPVTSIESKVASANSNAGTYTAAGSDLKATDVVLAPLEWVEYTITVSTAANVASSVSSSAELTLGTETENSNTLTLAQGKENITLGYTVNPRANYKVGQQLVYNIQVNNTGAGFAIDYNVSSAITGLSIMLANDNVASPYDATDVSGHPFTTWAITVTSVGANSDSQLSKISPVTDVDLVDVVSIAPNESVSYSIKATTKAVSISDIVSSVQAASENGATTVSQDVTVTAETLNTAPTITKKTLDKEYIPGGWVSYEITVTNTDSTKFINNFTLVDQISSCEKVEMNDGSKGPPFSEWKLAVKEIKVDGTDPGAFPYGVSQTGDITVMLDVAPAGHIIYTLDAKVDPKAIGTILDNGDCPGDNVSEKGEGLDTPEGKPEVLKEVDKFEFVPGQPVTFTITIKNSGKGPLTLLPVVDDIASIVARYTHGQRVNAFKGWTITTAVKDSTGAPSTNSNPDVDGTIRNNQSIRTHANIFPGDTVIYTIVAQTHADVTTPITNKVTAGDSAHSEATTTPKKYDLSLSKSVDKRSYSEGTKTLTYTLVLSSDPIGGFAENIPVDDDIQEVEAELLHPKGAKAKAFTSWVITAKAEGEGADTGINKDYPTAGLHAKASLPAGGKITYTIVAQIADRTQNHIVWGAITNKATATTDTGVISDSATTAYEVPDIKPSKTVDDAIYTPGQEVVYTLVIKNDGDGYANNTLVTDGIRALGLFDSWTLTYTATGLGTRVIEGVKDNEDLKTHVDIAPHSAITFNVKGIVKDNIESLGTITNTVKTHEPLTDRDADASADIDKDKSKTSFSITKVGESVYFTPGKTFTYTVTVTNLQSTPVKNLVLIDPLSTITADLANDQGGTHKDIEGNPFIRWCYREGKVKVGQPMLTTRWSDWSTNDVKITGLTLEGGETRIVEIKCEVKDNVVSRKITNLASINRTTRDASGKLTLEALGFAGVDSLRAGSGGVISYSYTPEFYKPGDDITYTIKATSKTGFFNNVSIKDMITDIRVDTIDNGPQHPFADVFTVSVDKVDSHKGGTTDGRAPDTGIVENNKNLDVIIDVGGGDSVTYTIKGKVIDNASGNINNSGMVSEPFDDQYIYKKTTEEANYTAGQPLTYLLTVTNTGKSHVTGLRVSDIFSTITTTDVDGKTIPAFASWTIRVEQSPIKDNPDTGAKPSYEAYYDAGTYTDDKDIDTQINVPIGGKLTYRIKATVADSASGTITNMMTVGSNTTSVITNPQVTNAALKKSIVGWYDAKGNTLPNKAYTPGGYLKYKVRLDNTYGGNIVDLDVEDRISEVTADWYSGVTGKAFESWTVTITTDEGGVTRADPVPDNRDIKGKVDIGVGGFIEYEIYALVNQEAVGAIINTVSAGKLKAESPTAYMDAANFSLSKKAYVDESLTLEKFMYLPSEKVYYKVHLENKGYGTFYGKTVVDKIKDIQVDIAEDATTYGKNPKANPFKEWYVKDIITTGRVTNNAGFSEGYNKNIDTRFDLAPLDDMCFVVEASIIDNAVGAITNIAKAGNQSSQRKLVQPRVVNTGVVKKIVSIAGTPYAGDNYYRPGDTVVYQAVIKNPGPSWYNDVAVNDSISDLQVRLDDGTTGQAFSNWTVTSQIETTNPVETYIPPVKDGDDISMVLDLAPHSIITFTMTATINNHAVGIIPANIIHIDSQEARTDSIHPIKDKPEIKAAFTVEEAHYTPNETLKYHLKLTNIGTTKANKVQVSTAFLASMGQYITGGQHPSFDGFEVVCEAKGEGSSCGGGIYPPNQDINAVINVGGSGSVEYTITPLVNINMLTPIDVTATFNFEDSTGFFHASSAHTRHAGSVRMPPVKGVKQKEDLTARQVLPIPSGMTVTKSVEKTHYVDEDKTLRYTLTAVNASKGNLPNVKLFDDLAGITSKVGKPVFRSWTFKAMDETGALISPQPPADKNLDMAWVFANYSRNKLTIEVEATFQGNIDEEVINTFVTTDENTTVVVQDDAKCHVKRKAQGEGELSVMKTSRQPQIQPGGAVEYEILVENANDSMFEDISVIDQYPAGFRYVEGSARISYAKAGGTFSDKFLPISPIVNNVLTFFPITLDNFEKCRIRYVLKASIAIDYGSYKNVAFANNEDRGKISNDSFAMVSVLGDKLFDTASIIGKVFEDHNGNGYQSDATAKNIKVKAAVPTAQYIPQSTYVRLGDQHQQIVDKQQPAIRQGVVIKELPGKSSHQADKPTSASVIFKTQTDTAFPLSVVSETGSRITFDNKGNVQKQAEGKLKNGLNSENLQVTRNVYKQDQHYLWEIMVENHGVYDDGIPGVRLITAEGFKLETDEYGRFHVPDRWVLDRKGKNVVVKVDTDSLPTGMQIISENPKVQRITPNKLNKFNFSAQRKATQASADTH